MTAAQIGGSVSSSESCTWSGSCLCSACCDSGAECAVPVHAGIAVVVVANVPLLMAAAFSGPEQETAAPLSISAPLRRCQPRVP